MYFYEGVLISMWLLEFTAFLHEKEHCPDNNHPSIGYCQILIKLRYLVIIDSPWKHIIACALAKMEKEVLWTSRVILCEKKTSLRPRIRLSNTMGNLHHHFQCKKVIFRILLQSHKLEWMRTFYTTNWKNSQYIVGGSEIENARDRRSHRHITCTGGFDFEWKLIYDEAMLNLGAAFAHHKRLTVVFDIVQLQSVRVLAMFHNRGGNIESPQNTGDQTAALTVGFSGRFGAEGQYGSVSQKCHSEIFLEYTRNNRRGQKMVKTLYDFYRSKKITWLIEKFANLKHTSHSIC